MQIETGGSAITRANPIADSTASGIKDNWDAIVIGAGPAGAVSALLLARQGLSVLLVDKAPFPRTKVCGSCLSVKTLRALRRAGLEALPARLSAKNIRGFQLNTTSAALSLPLPSGLSISRQALDNAIVQEAITAGAVFLPATTGEAGPCLGDFRTMRLRSGDSSAAQITLSARCLLIADGLGGRSLANLDGAERDQFEADVAPASRIGAGTIIDDQNLSQQYADGIIYMAVHRGGYVGLVRLEDGRLDMAAAFDPSFTKTLGSPQAAARQILQECGFALPHNFEDFHWSGTPPLTRRRKKLAAKRLLVVGDAASYGEPFTGEGIAWAIESALLAVPLGINAIANWQDNIALQWQSIHKERIWKRQKTSRVLGLMLRHDGLSKLVVGGVFNRIPALATPIINKICR